MEKKKGLLRYIILGVVIANREIHGYGIYKEILKLSSGRWKPSIGTTYRLLNELLRDGYIAEKHIPGRGRKKTRLYYATDRGVEKFLEATLQFLDKIHPLMELLVKIIDRLRREQEFREKTDNLFTKLSYIRGILEKAK